ASLPRTAGFFFLSGGRTSQRNPLKSPTLTASVSWSPPFRWAFHHPGTLNTRGATYNGLARRAPLPGSLNTKEFRHAFAAMPGGTAHELVASHERRRTRPPDRPPAHGKPVTGPRLFHARRAHGLPGHARRLAPPAYRSSDPGRRHH